jgi:hypothetical protein
MMLPSSYASLVDGMPPVVPAAFRSRSAQPYVANMSWVIFEGLTLADIAPELWPMLAVAISAFLLTNLLLFIRCE